MTTHDRQAVAAFAQVAHANGFNVIPPSEDGRKQPWPNGQAAWSDWQQRRATDAELRQWYGGARRAGVGIVAGAVSGGLEVLDFDHPEAYGDWRDVCQAAGLGGIVDRITAGWCDETPSGGRHLYYRCQEVAGNTKLAQREKQAHERNHERDRLATLIETRGEGGFIIAAPSGGPVHPSGDPYRLLSGGPATIAAITPEERAALHEVARSLDQQPDRAQEWRPRDGGAAPAGAPGTDFNARGDWGRDVLIPAGWAFVYERNGVGYWRRPGKRDGISATTNWGGFDFLHVFTSSTELEPSCSYSKWRAYGFLHHGGDWQAAARALGAQGYGEQRTQPTITIGGTREAATMAQAQAQSIADDAAGIEHQAPPDNVRTFPGTDTEPGDTNGETVRAGSLTFRLTDLGNADVLAERIRDRFIWAGQRNAWFRYEGGCWKASTKREIYEEARQSILDLYQHVPSVANDEARKAFRKHLAASEGSRRIDAAVDKCRSRPGIPVDDSELDRDPLLLNVLNGTIALATGQLRPHDPNDRCTKQCPVVFDPGAAAPQWQAFLDRVLPDPEIQRFVQTFIGLAATGRTTHILPVAHGRGANGKSTFVDVVMKVLGQYAIQSPIETFMQGKHDQGGPSPELARLQGARLVFTSEGSAGQRLNVGRLKMLTGGEPIAARRLYADYVEFDPSHAVWVSTNHRPIVPGDDGALWRRLRLIPFTVTIPEDERDERLKEKLLGEAAGILNWILAGHAAYQRDGKIHTPPAVMAATAAYRADQDEVGHFLEWRCIEDRRARVTAKEIYTAYRAWVFETQGDEAEPMNQKIFGGNLSQRGYDRVRGRDGFNWLGLRLRGPADPPRDGDDGF